MSEPLTRAQFVGLWRAYIQAKADYEAAEKRYDELGNELMAAQCRGEVSRVPIPGDPYGSVRVLVCNLERGHSGDHAHRSIEELEGSE